MESFNDSPAAVSRALTRLDTHADTVAPLLQALGALNSASALLRGGPVVHRASPAPETDPSLESSRYACD